MSPGVPYVSVRSNDVLNGSLDLVLRLCTRVDTVWRVLRPGREVGIFLLDPLPSRLFRLWTHKMDTSSATDPLLAAAQGEQAKDPRHVDGSIFTGLDPSVQAHPSDAVQPKSECVHQSDLGVGLGRFYF